MNAFLLHHSQKLAVAGFFGSSLLVCAIQPYAEVFTRWSQIKVNRFRELLPSKRVLLAVDKVCARFQLPPTIMQQLDIFLTDSDESVALGTFTESNYAFVGLPFYANYVDESEISLRELKFATPSFPHTAYSKLGQERISLMLIPQEALEFLIAREIVSLLGSKKLKHLTAVEESLAAANSFISFPSSQMASRVSLLSFTLTGYLSYQVSYILNRVLRLRIVWPLPARFLAYLGITGSLFLCQHQLLVAWRRKLCFNLDKAVGAFGDDMRAGGIAYYNWKARLNAFWARRFPESIQALKVLRRTTEGLHDLEIPPQVKHQLQMALVDPSYMYKSPQDYYFVPPLITNRGRDRLRLDEVNLDHRNTSLPAYKTSTSNGDELFAADGFSLSFSLSGLLTFGAFPAGIAGLLGVLFAPATCSQRKAALERDLLALNV